MNEELNKKLALWAGFAKHRQFSDWWYRPDGRDISRLPRFTSSLDACFKWLEPKLLSYQLNNWGNNNHHCVIHREGVNYVGAYAKTPALALCLAIEKLIEEELSG